MYPLILKARFKKKKKKKKRSAEELSNDAYVMFFFCSLIFFIKAYEGESIKNRPNLFLGEIDLFFFDVIAL